MRKQQDVVPLAVRFWQKVEKTEECWVWVANCTKDKYGNRRYGLLSAGRRGDGMLYAHRVSWELHNGPIPDGLFVLHRCDNTQCVRPSHLFLGDQHANMDDMQAKGRRGTTGPKVGTGARSKLAPQQIVQMRCDKATHTYEELAVKYGVCRATVFNILSGRTNQNR